MSATEAAARVALHLDARSKLVAPDPVIEGLGVEGVSTTVTADDLHTLVGAVFAPFPDAVLVAVGVDYCRALLKRTEGHRGSPAEWTANLRFEVAQTVGVLLNIAHHEGFDLADALEEVIDGLRARPTPAAS